MVARAWRGEGEGRGSGGLATRRKGEHRYLSLGSLQDDRCPSELGTGGGVFFTP